MTRILFRCDASLSIGSGHVIRCRTLGRELQQRGAEVLFLCRRQPGDLIALLEKDFRVLPLPVQPLAACDGLDDRELYAAWLGCSQRQDVDDCLSVCSKAGISSVDWLVVDHYGLDVTWQSQLLTALRGQAPVRLLAIDDLADRSHQADLLLDQNFFGTSTDQRYGGLVPTHCRQLLGPHYALLGPEYAQLRPLVPARTEFQRVLVFFGGVDPDNLTTRVLEALMDPALSHLAVDVVLGHQSPHRQVVVNLVNQRKFTTLHDPLPSLAALIARADLAIGAGGATTWERACLRLPSLVVAIAANQVPFAKALAHAGHHQLLGESATVSVEQIRSKLLSMKVDFNPQNDICDLTDGFGVSRLALTMLGSPVEIRLRSVRPDDGGILLHWAQNFKLDANSFSPELIGLTVNEEFLKKNIESSDCLCLIVTTANGCPIGQIKFERDPTILGKSVHEAQVALLFDRCALDRALFFKVIRRALQVMDEHWGPFGEGLSEMPTSPACYVRSEFSTEFGYSSVSGCELLQLPRSFITILSDLGSWLNTYLPELILALWQRGHAVRWIHDPSSLRPGDVCLLLSCSRLLSPEKLALHKHNLVVHESALPQGQGWSPMTWQILEGVKNIPITLFEATVELDAGQIYLQRQIELIGYELVDEWRALQANATMQLCCEWVDRYKEIVASALPQNGKATQYRRRRSTDSQLDPERSLADQFNLLRVVDNRQYPAFFNWNGKHFVIKVYS